MYRAEHRPKTKEGYPNLTVVAVRLEPQVEAGDGEEGVTGVCGEPSPLSRSKVGCLFFEEIVERILCFRWRVTTPGFSGLTAGSTLV